MMENIINYKLQSKLLKIQSQNKNKSMHQDLIDTSFLRIPNIQDTTKIQVEIPIFSSFLKIENLAKMQVLVAFFKELFVITIPISDSNSTQSELLIANNTSVKFECIRKNSQLTSFKIIGSGSNSTLNQLVFSCDSPFIMGKWVTTLQSQMSQCDFHSKFKPIKKLGKGNFATVYQVERNSDSKRFAAKAFSESKLSETKDGFKVLQTQIQILRKLNHQNILKIQGVYQSDNSIYVLTNLLTGGSLLHFLQKKKMKIDYSDQKQIMFGICQGLAYLHKQRIIHRDLKPENIMLLNSSGSLIPVIIDFGLSIFSDANSYLYSRCGTPGFVAPEIFNTQQNGQHIEPESDIFSAGAIFHIMLTGRPLFQGTTGQQVYNNNKAFIIPFKELRYSLYHPQGMQLITKMMELDPTKRIKAEQCLKHSFFDEIYEDKSLLNSGSTTQSQMQEEQLAF